MEIEQNLRAVEQLQSQKKQSEGKMVDLHKKLDKAKKREDDLLEQIQIFQSGF